MEISGFTLPPKEVPIDTLMSPPKRPVLSMMQWAEQSEKSSTAVVPQSVCDKWKRHESFTQDFQRAMTELRETYGIFQAGQSGAQALQKKRIGSEIKTENPSRKLKTETVEAASTLPLPSAVLLEVPVGKAVLAICEGDRVFVANKREDALVIPACTMLASWAKGSFAIISSDAAIPTTGIQWVLNDSANVVYADGVVQTIGKIINDKRHNEPSTAKVWAHNMSDSPTPADVSNVLLKANKNVYYTPSAPDTETMDVNSVGFKLLIKQWASSVTEIVWNVRWNPTRGLVPIKPMVVTTQTINLPAGCYLELAS